jgi:hypothetical protein
MRVERGRAGGITVHGTAAEWARFGVGIKDLYRSRTLVTNAGARVFWNA